MTPAEAAQAASIAARRRAEDKAEFRRDLGRLAREREGMTVDAMVIRWDEPERKPWIA